jgi:hypothetical protein
LNGNLFQVNQPAIGLAQVIPASDAGYDPCNRRDLRFETGFYLLKRSEATHSINQAGVLMIF